MFLRLYALIYVAFLYGPLLLIVLFSFHSSPSLSFPLEGFSLRWYYQLFSDPGTLASLQNSCIVGFCAAIATAIIGSCTALGLSRLSGPFKTSIAFLNFAPIGLPGLFLGIALLILFAQMGLERSLLTVIIGHVLFTLPFFIEAARSRVEYFDLSLEEASRDLGATAQQTFRLITLPIILPTLIGATILTFAISFDEFIITVFTSGNDDTLPLFIWGMMRRSVTPVINAASVVALSLSLVVIALAGMTLRFQQHRSRIRRKVNSK